MKYVYLFLSGGLLAVWLLAGSTAGIGGLPVPALGEFFSPGQGFWQNGKEQLIERSTERSLVVDHPLAKGDVFFDGRGVPHIFAPDLASAAFLQGYVNAADRMWQMDISTRATEGTLSEVLGARTQVRDRGQKSKGFPRSAKNAVDTMARYFPADLAILEAYADGVNAYLAGLEPEDYPVEYKLLGHAPLRWSPYRTVLLMKGMSQALSGSYDDAAEAKTRALLGPDVFNKLYPERYPDPEPVVPASGTYKRRKPEGKRQRSALLAPQPPNAPASAAPPEPAEGPENFSAYQEEVPASNGPVRTGFAPHPDNGSNNWAVDGKHSNTGRPLLASDPHLSLTLPSIWSEVQLHYPGVNARGVGLPGAPGIMIGYNDFVAYGETNVGHDVTDWFRITWTDSTRTAYLLDGEVVAADIVTDTLRVRNGDTEIIRTPWTVFGPVPYTDGPYADHAMRYLGHDAPGSRERPHTSVGTFLQLMAARNYDDYQRALRGYVDPAQNFVFAERTGTIAIRPNGFFPLRAAGNGRFPLAGDVSANNWRGYLPFTDRPEHRNPARGFVASANQRSAAADFDYDYHGGFAEYRGRRVNDQLRRREKMTQRDMKELQLDSYNLLAEELTPLLIARINRRALTEEGTRLLRLISEWDYRCTAESRAATLFSRWRKRVYALTFDEMPRDSGYVRPETWRWNELLAKEPRHPIFDIDSTANFRETAATLTQRAFDEILEELEGKLPVTWAEERNTKVNHLGGIPGFGTGLIVAPGARNTPRALSAGHGASWRMVVELGERPRAWGVLPGGASGAPASPAYDNGVDDWTNGRYHELTRWADSEEAARKATGHWRFE